MKQVIFFKEHHGKVVLDWSTPEIQRASALSVVIGRFSGDNAYYIMEPPEPPPELDFKEEDIDKLPASMQADARVQLEQNKSAHAAYQREKKMDDAIQKCIQTKDGALALRIINARSHFEDEGFEVFEVFEVYDQYPAG